MGISKRILIIGIVTAATALNAIAHTSVMDTLRTRVYFRQGESRIDMEYGDNKTSLSHYVDSLVKLSENPDCQILSISIEGSASPEGSASLNNSLALKRAQNLKNHIVSLTRISPDIVSACSIGIDWKSLLTLLEKSDIQNRERLTEIISENYQSHPELLQSRLKALDGGASWREMMRRFFPEMRQGSASMICHTRSLTDNTICGGLKSDHPLIEPITDNTSEWLSGKSCTTDAESNLAENHETTGLLMEKGIDNQKDIRKHNFCLGLNTNMLYDALLMPSIGIELPIGENWSVTAGWTYAWWNKDSKHRYWRFYGGDAAVRRWFGRQHCDNGKLSGHHLGVAGSVFTFDFETGGKGYMGGMPGGKMTDQACWAAGIEYGYSLPVARRLNIDFSIAAGYAGGKYYKYRPEDDCYVTLNTSRMHYVGPTKAEISLVWILGGRKGGAK